MQRLDALQSGVRMTNELNVPAFVQTLRRYWLLILLTVLLAMGAAVAFSLLQTREYQAQSLLLVRTPQYQWRFDPSVQPIVDARRDWRRDFMLLGQTRRVAQRVAEDLSLSNADNLLRRVTLRASGGDSIVLEASGPTPEAAADLANSWSEALQAVVAETYGNAMVSNQAAGPQQQFTTELQQSLSALEQFKAETGLALGSANIRTENPLDPTQKEWDNKATLLADYRVAHDILNRLSSQVGDAQAGRSPAEAVAWDLLDTSPVLFARPALQPEQRPSASDLAGWAGLLQREASGIQDTIAWLDGEVNRLQAQLAAEDALLYQLQQKRDVTSEAYVAVLRKLNEVAYQQAIDPVGIEILETAQNPQQSTAWPLALRLAVAALGGLVVGIGLALLWDRFVARSPRLANARTPVH